MTTTFIQKKINELEPWEQALLEKAETATESAYAPYSRIQVGVALKDNQGAEYQGCNVENVAYPNGVCAETSAISAYVIGRKATDKDSELSTVALASNLKDFIFPCGACRQRLAEFSSDSCRILISNGQGDVMISDIKDLLPGCFNLTL